MLNYLHVKNLAVIRDEEVVFGNGLNILTGETGAGKSVLLGSVELALGMRASKDMIRHGADFALVELGFELDDTPESIRIIKKLSEDDLFPDGNTVTLSRKITKDRSIARINGETVSAGVLSRVAGLLLDVHGQQDNAILLKRKNHRELLDAYGTDADRELLSQVRDAWKAYKSASDELDASMTDSSVRSHELEILEHEINEIENARLRSGEDEELEAEYVRLSNTGKLAQLTGEGHEVLTCDGGTSESLGRCIREITEAASYDESLSEIAENLLAAESLIDEAARSIARYTENLEYAPQRMDELSSRLDTLNHLKNKYNTDIDGIIALGSSKEEEAEKLRNYESYIEKLRIQRNNNRKILVERAQKLSQVRKDLAASFEQEIVENLKELNFAAVDFRIMLTPLSEPGADGAENVEFYVSLNPGEKPKPLALVASGGELSRIMLAIKTVLSDKDDIPTLIFDEIDTGISGITASKVGDKLHEIAENRQVICISHLAQIAARADDHFVITKEILEDSVETHIKPVSGEDSVCELARILGGSEISDAVMANAREMKYGR